MKLVCTVLTVIFSVSGAWYHTDQVHWPPLCQTGTRQSPIDLDPDVELVAQSLEKFHFHNYDIPQKVFAKNSGHSLEVRGEKVLKITGGGLSKEYTLDHLHFHWKSEHTLDGYRFPLEVHLVHYATTYENLPNALKYDDGVAVLGVFYDYSPDDEDEFDPFNQIISHVESNHNSFEVAEPIIFKTFLPRDHAGFYRYDGSLTTPNCTESVIWTLFTNTIPISKDQVSRFEALRQSNLERLKVNYRDTQPLGKRKLYHKISPLPHDDSSKSQYNLLLLVLAFCLLYKF